MDRLVAARSARLIRDRRRAADSTVPAPNPGWRALLAQTYPRLWPDGRVLSYTPDGWIDLAIAMSVAVSAMDPQARIAGSVRTDKGLLSIMGTCTAQEAIDTIEAFQTASQWFCHECGNLAWLHDRGNGRLEALCFEHGGLDDD